MLKRTIKTPAFTMALSMTVFGTIAPFVKGTGLTPGEVALYRALLATFLVGMFLIITNQPIPFLKLKKSVVVLLIISGTAMAFNWIFLFEAFNYTSVSVATLSYYFAPVIVTIACPILFKEKMGAKQWICFAGSTAGIILLTLSNDIGEGSNHFIGIGLGLSAAVLYAMVILLNKYIKELSGIQRTFLQFVSASAVLLVYVLPTQGFNLGTLDIKAVICLLTVGFVHTGLTYCMYFTSLKNLSGQKSAILSYIDPLVAVIVSIVYLGEAISVTQCIGGILILGFTLWNEIRISKK